MPVPFKPQWPIPQPRHYTHQAMPVPFKLRTSNPPAQSLHPLRYTGSIHSGRYIQQPSHCTHYTMLVPINLQAGHTPAQSLHPLRYGGSIQTTEVYPPTLSTHPLRYAGSIQNQRFYNPAQSLQPLCYAGSIQAPHGPSRSPDIIPTTLWRFHSNNGRSIPQPSQYVVWKVSNDTEILLNMNFIIFTNQDYPLQNSSIVHLHSAGGVVYSVRSSAESFCR